MDRFAKHIIILFALLYSLDGWSQELDAKVTINHNQVQGTDVSIFENLEETLTRFINEKQWTSLQFMKNERIACNFNITVTKHDATANLFECRAVIQANRPVYNSAYTTTIYNNTDNDFTFTFAQFDQIEFNEEVIDNQLTALIAYYAYLIIGIDLDTFGPMAGEDILQRCLNLCNGALQPLRQLQYDYYRKGLDEMASNAERGRTNITDALENGLKKAHDNRPMSLVPQIWTDYKKDELANIYKGKGTSKEKESVYNILFGINESQSATWDKIKQ